MQTNSNIDKTTADSTEVRTDNRILGYDLAKTIAMFLVVLLHSVFYIGGIPDRFTTRVILSLTVICVPLFITVNGAIILNRNLNINRHINKTISMFALLIVWRAIHVLIYEHILGSQHLGAANYISVLLGNTNISDYPLGHFWFLEALIAIYIIVPLIKAAFDQEDRRPLYLILVSAFILSFGLDTLKSIVSICCKTDGDAIVESLSRLNELNIFSKYGYLLIYFVAGGLLEERRRADSSKNNCREHTTLLCIIACCISALITATFHELQYLSKIAGPFATQYGYWLPSTLVFVIAAMFLFTEIGNRIQTNTAKNILFLFGSNTLGVYLMHMFGLLAVARWHFNDLLINFSPLFQCLFLLIFDIALFISLSCISAALKRIPLVKNLFKL